MNIAIGILAHNEVETVGTLIGLLSKQSLFGLPEYEVSLHVVPNGCDDDTASCARKALDLFAIQHPETHVYVNELESPGKANAWNKFVHELSSPSADFLFLLDADIQPCESNCLLAMVEALKANREADVVVDTPIKDFGEHGRQSTRSKLSLAASELHLAGVPKLTGQLYCMRSEAARKVWMPMGLLVEDGFIRAMLLTAGFSEPENTAKIMRAPGASHYYKAIIHFSDWFKHEKRILIGTAVNIMLFELLPSKAAILGHTGTLIRDKNLNDPDWVSHLVSEKIRWRLPGGFEFLSLPLMQLGTLDPSRRLKALPAAVIRSLLNTGVAIASWNDIRRGNFRW